MNALIYKQNLYILNNMDKLADKLDELDDNWLNDFHTPQTLAWKLLMSDDIQNLSSTITSFNVDNNDSKQDPISFTFEIMITIFAEMLCSLMLIVSEDDKNVRANMCISDFFETIKNKLLGASVTLHINSLEKEWVKDDSKYFNNILDKRYCKLILRDNKDELIMFHTYDVPEETMYHMLLNPKYKKQKNLRDIQAMLSSGDYIYLISFDFFKRTSQDVPNII